MLLKMPKPHRITLWFAGRNVPDDEPAFERWEVGRSDMAHLTLTLSIRSGCVIRPAEFPGGTGEGGAGASARGCD